MNTNRIRSKGHWFCNHCDDVVFMSYEKPGRGIPCPVCGNLSCEWVPAAITRKVLGEYWFSQMRRVVAESATPELPSQDFPSRASENLRHKLQLAKSL